MRIALIVLVPALAVLGCNRPSGPVSAKHSRQVMGTFAAVTAVAVDQATARAAVEAAYARLDDVNRLMSDYVDDSEIGRLNQLPAGGSLVVSPETFECLRQAIEIAEASGGAFDVTCRPLVKLWRRAGRENRLPTEAELAAARARVGWQKLRLDADTRTVTVPVEGLQVDLGGIAKGYALDLAAQAMQDAGATGGLVDVGGDIVAFGRRENGQAWRVGVRDPFARDRNACRLTLRIEDAAVATSGVQERFTEIEGKRYSHIVDPRTGRPVEQAPAVTVIAPDGATADAWATVFSVLSPADGRVLIQQQLQGSGIEVMWITGTAEDPQIEKTAGFDRYVVK